MNNEGLDRHIGKMIAEKRQSDSLKAIADASGVNVERLKKIERGVEHPTESELRTLACALGTSPEKLLPPGIILDQYQ